MTALTTAPADQTEAFVRALEARDPRFDGVFFVGITTTRVYCRVLCPSRAACSHHRRFFDSAAAAERAGFRPCLRCRPELAPGRAAVDVVSQLARAAVQRIAAGALNGHSVAQLAHELGVSERHLRRALEREMGVSPLELAQTQRLLLAKRLLADTPLPMTRVAYASGFQSLRRFNAAFRTKYGMPPSAVRRRPAARRMPRPAEAEGLQLTLAYRPPLAWDALLDLLGRHATPHVEVVGGGRYARTVRIGEQAGVISAAARPNHVAVSVSATLFPALMPLIAGLRRLFDLDAEPAAVDAHLGKAGLGPHVARCPGLRVPGALDGFEIALRTLLHSAARAGHVTAVLGEPLMTGVAGLTHLAPTAARIAEAGADRLIALGVPSPRARGIATLARAVTLGTLRLEPGADVATARRALLEIESMSERMATWILMRALYWPDAFPSTDRGLQRAVGAHSAAALRTRAEQWRPWRAYAALHLTAVLPD